MRTDGPVIIALDGSPRSGRTLDWGVDEATRRGAPVVLVRTYQDPVEYPLGWSPLVVDPSVLAEAKDYLDRQEDIVRRRYPYVAASSRLIHGPVVPALRDESERAQLLVIGAGGRAGGTRLGSTAAHLAAHARCPIAVVRPLPHLEPDDEEYDSPATRPVVAGVDGSHASCLAAHVAATAAVSRGVRLELVCVRPTVRDPMGAVAVTPLTAPESADPTHQLVLQVADALRDEHVGLDVRPVFLQDDPAHGLAETSRHAQLLVVGSRGLGAFRGMLLGAVSAHALREAECTVLVVHGGAGN